MKSNNIVPSQKAKNLGIIFDQTLSMADQVSALKMQKKKKIAYVRALHNEKKHVRSQECLFHIG